MVLKITTMKEQEFLFVDASGREKKIMAECEERALDAIKLDSSSNSWQLVNKEMIELWSDCVEGQIFLKCTPSDKLKGTWMTLEGMLTNKTYLTIEQIDALVANLQKLSIRLKEVQKL